MSVRAGKCANKGACSLANRGSSAAIEIGRPFVCPECGSPLNVTPTKQSASQQKVSSGSGGGSSRIVIGVLAVLLLFAGAYYFGAYGLFAPDEEAAQTNEYGEGKRETLFVGEFSPADLNGKSFVGSLRSGSGATKVAVLQIRETAGVDTFAYDLTLNSGESRMNGTLRFRHDEELLESEELGALKIVHIANGIKLTSSNPDADPYWRLEEVQQ